MVDQCLLQSFDLWKMEEETASTEDRTDGLIALWELQRMLVTHLIAEARMIFLGKTRVGHRQSDKHLNGFKGNVRETSERVERIWAFSSS